MKINDNQLISEGCICIMGSGEISPHMTTVHKNLLNRIEHINAVFLETPYGFQENLTKLTNKVINYFKRSLYVDIIPSGLMALKNFTLNDQALILQTIKAANYVFSGPGSPSYALNQWRPIGLTDALYSVVNCDGIICFSSAAAITLGLFAAPIYEIYKVGEEPKWIEGLDLLGRFGLKCVVIPHFDNTDGNGYDTRFCYLGERRKLLLESLLADDIATLGVDEHTAILLDFKSNTASVYGKNNAYWCIGKVQLTIKNGTTVSLDALKNTSICYQLPQPNYSTGQLDNTRQSSDDATSLSINQLYYLISLLKKFDHHYNHFKLMIENLLALRLTARTNRHFVLADQLREILTSAGIEIHDTKHKTTWQHKPLDRDI